MKIKEYLLFNWHILFWGLIFFTCFIHIIISLYDTPGFWTDSFIYLLQADYFSNWQSGNSPVLEQAIAYRTFPPLYPLYLSIWGAGSGSILKASVLTSLLLMPICLFYVNWQYQQGMNKLHAQLNAMLFLILPGTLLLSTELWSENLYLLFVMMTLWFYSKADSSTDRWLYLSALTCGFALMTRSVGLSLVVSFLIVTLRRGKVKTIFSTIIIFMPWLIWNQISNDIAYSSRYIDEDTLKRYIDPNDFYIGILDSLFLVIKIQLQTFWWAIQLQFNNYINNSTAVISAIILIATCYTLYVRLVRFSLDALYFMFNVGIIFVWYFPDQNTRFLYVIIPFLFFYSQSAVISWSRNFSERAGNVIAFFIPLLVFISILPCLIFMHDRLVHPPTEYVHRISNDRVWLTEISTENAYKKLIYKEKLIESAINIKSIVAEDECVYSIYPEIIMLYGQRKSIVPPFGFVSNNDFVEGVNECRYIFAVGAPHNQHEPLYPIDRVKDISWILQQNFYPEEYGSGIISVLLELDK